MWPQRSSNRPLWTPNDLTLSAVQTSSNDGHRRSRGPGLPITAALFVDPSPEFGLHLESGGMALRPTPISLAKVANVQPHLTTAAWDGWLLGGASIVIWGLMSLLDGVGRSIWVVDRQFDNLTALASTLALVLVYPHVLASYRLAYDGTHGWLRRYWVQLIAVPFLLSMTVMGSYFLYTIAPQGSLLQQVNAGLRTLGIQTTIGLQPTLGAEAMGLLVQAMLAMVGWHCARQALWCTRVMAHYEGYVLSESGWQLLRISLIGVWLSGLAGTNIGPIEGDFMGLAHASLGLPVGTAGALCGVATIAALGFASTVFRTARETGQRPSISVLVAPVAFVTWWFPPLVQDAFLLLMVPVFHAVQYLALVYKVDKHATTTQPRRAHPMRYGLRLMMMVALGFIVFELAPAYLDNILNTSDTLGVPFFIAAAAVVLNIHHFVIDQAVWRFRNSTIRGIVFG